MNTYIIKDKIKVGDRFQFHSNNSYATIKHIELDIVSGFVMETDDGNIFKIGRTALLRDANKIIT